MKSPKVEDKFVTKVKEEPNSLSGTSKETGFPGSKVTYSSVVVDIFFFGCFSTSHAKPLDAGFYKARHIIVDLFY